LLSGTTVSLDLEADQNKNKNYGDHQLMTKQEMTWLSLKVQMNCFQIVSPVDGMVTSEIW
jgi:hypothetical protein